MSGLRWLSIVALVVAAPAPARADDELAALRAELEAQRAKIAALETTHDRAEAEDAEGTSSLRVYGFMDVGIQKMFLERHSLATAVLQSDATTFVLGNVNLYFDAHPVAGWRGLVEVRLTNAPDGSDTSGSPGTPYSRFNTEVLDPTSPSGGWVRLRWGALVLERAHVDWRHGDGLNLRAGLFLTPAGIWNVDHGSPTLIALQAPQFLVNEMFPARQTGLQLFGTHHLERWALDYALYVTNGRSAQQLDLTEDKAFGGRFVLRRGGPTRLALGTSFYVNRFSDQLREVYSIAPVTAARIETIAYDEQTLGLDASLDVGALRLRAEAALRHIVYDEGKHASWFNIAEFLLASRNDASVYVLAAYQLPRLGLEPFVTFELQRSPNLLGEGQAIPALGLNLRFTPATTLKAQISHAFTWGAWATRANDVTFAAARAVLAF